MLLADGQYLFDGPVARTEIRFGPHGGRLTNKDLAKPKNTRWCGH